MTGSAQDHPVHPHPSRQELLRSRIYHSATQALCESDLWRPHAASMHAQRAALRGARAKQPHISRSSSLSADPQAMEPSAVTKMMQGVWDSLSPAYNRFVDERMMASAASLVVAAVEDYWENHTPRRQGEPPCMAHGHSSASRSGQTHTPDDVPRRGCQGQGNRSEAHLVLTQQQLFASCARPLASYAVPNNQYPVC